MSKIPIKIVEKGGIGRKVFKGSELVLGGNQPLPMTQADYDALASFSPSSLPNLAAWFKFNTGITDSGGAVSQWADQSGNGRHLKQATATNQPAKQGDGSILFDGVDNFLKCDAFTLNQPETIYLLGRQLGWLSSAGVFDGNSGNVMLLQQTNGGASPQLRLFAGSGTSSNSDLALNTYGAVACVFNGASSLIQVNSNAAVTGNAGAGNGGGFTLGANGANSGWTNIQVKEVIIYSAAHDAATRAQVIAYLNAL